jgi:phage terminase large subunit-like protein
MCVCSYILIRAAGHGSRTWAPGQYAVHAAGLPRREKQTGSWCLLWEGLLNSRLVCVVLAFFMKNRSHLA